MAEVPLFPRDQLELIRQKLRQLPEPPARPVPTRDDWLGAAGVFCWSFSQPSLS
jgi:hypothetical protein